MLLAEKHGFGNPLSDLSRLIPVNPGKETLIGQNECVLHEVNGQTEEQTRLKTTGRGPCTAAFILDISEESTYVGMTHFFRSSHLYGKWAHMETLRTMHTMLDSIPGKKSERLVLLLTSEDIIPQQFTDEGMSDFYNCLLHLNRGKPPHILRTLDYAKAANNSGALQLGYQYNPQDNIHTISVTGTPFLLEGKGEELIQVPPINQQLS